ncbi:protein kinase [bacterium]|nr:protein kinase [bacterium]
MFCPRCGGKLGKPVQFCPQCGSDISDIVKLVSSKGGETAAATEEVQFRIGTPFGKYEILQVLGEGSMGTVLKAKDTEKGTIVSLKILPKHLGKNEMFVERFRREARALYLLDHPNICKISDNGEQAGFHYMAMELVDGDSLKSRIAEGPVPENEIYGILRQICEALLYADTQGITHRDLTPGNIMQAKSGGVKVIDFGIAKLVNELTISKTGTLIGTPAYMAPEQFGRAHDVDRRADIWSIGVIAYEMAAGKRPFEGATPMSTIKHITDETYMPDKINIVNPKTSLKLAIIISKCLQRNKLKRYQSFEDVLEDIQREKVIEKEEEPVMTQASPPPPPSEAHKKKIPMKWLVAGGVAGVIVLVGLAVGITMMALSPDTSSHQKAGVAIKASSAGSARATHDEEASEEGDDEGAKSSVTPRAGSATNKRAAIFEITEAIRAMGGNIELVDGRFGQYYINDNGKNVFIKFTTTQKNQYAFDITKMLLAKGEEVGNDNKVYIVFICGRTDQSFALPFSFFKKHIQGAKPRAIFKLSRGQWIFRCGMFETVVDDKLNNFATLVQK